MNRRNPLRRISLSGSRVRTPASFYVTIDRENLLAGQCLARGLLYGRYGPGAINAVGLATLDRVAKTQRGDFEW